MSLAIQRGQESGNEHVSISAMTISVLSSAYSNSKRTRYKAAGTKLRKAELGSALPATDTIVGWSSCVAYDRVTGVEAKLL